MHAIVLVGSPRKGGNTDCLAEAFLEGARAAGGTGEKVFLDDLDIRPIAEVGDVHAERVDVRGDDDYLPTLRQTLAADILVFASPVYWQGVSAQMKCFVDRWSAHYVQPFLVEGMRGKVIAALVPHAAPEADHARWVTEPVKVWAAHFHALYAGEVSCVAAGKGTVCEQPCVLEQARGLGRRCVELAKQGRAG